MQPGQSQGAKTLRPDLRGQFLQMPLQILERLIQLDYDLERHATDPINQKPRALESTGSFGEITFKRGKAS